jgi:hypothetical protein
MQNSPMINLQLHNKDVRDIIDILLNSYECYKDRHNSADYESALKAKRLADKLYKQEQEQLTK